jgi:hypothetical protein
MLQLQRRIAIAGVLASSAIGFVVQPVAAIHHNAVLDCGTAGTYPIKTQETGAGIFPPSFIQVDLLTVDGKPAGTLVPQAMWINGVQIEFVGAAYDPLSANHTLATCTFTGTNGDYVVLVGILNIR